jgi:hypothetical protein
VLDGVYRCDANGVLAPNAKLRSLVVPQQAPAQAQAASEAAAPAECDVQTVQRRG